MAKAKIAHITGSTVGRHRVIGRDDDGVNIEEKVCPIRGEVFMDGEGNVTHHPLENGRIPSPEGARAGQVTKEEGILNHRWLPIAECPYTERYRHLTKGPLVTPPKGESDCGGKPEGCEHWHRIRESRTAKSKDAAKTRNITPDNAGATAIQNLGESIAKWTQAQMVGAQPIQKVRGRMRDGKGEDDQGQISE